MPSSTSSSASSAASATSAVESSASSAAEGATSSAAESTASTAESTPSATESASSPVAGEHGSSKRRAPSPSASPTSLPPPSYTCNLCAEKGHWIQLCPLKKRRKTSHVPVSGVDPSAADKELARAMQRLPSPQCFCGARSRVKKVKDVKDNPGSSAIGVYFFFCAKKKGAGVCRFAKVAEVPGAVGGGEGVVRKARKEAVRKGGREGKGDVRGRGHDGGTKNCVFFKKGTCRNGKECAFRH